MTPQEATQQLFAAAKKGDTAAVQAALDAGADDSAKDSHLRDPLIWAQINGHTDTARFLADRNSAISAKRNRRDNNAAETGMLVAGVLWAAMFLGVFPYVVNKRNTPIPAPNKQPIPEAAQQRLRSALKDPAMTDRVIEQLKDPSLIERFTADPDIMRNLQKLAETIEGDVAEKDDWADKVIREKGSQRLERD